mgnify:CR=1 FL=1
MSKQRLAGLILILIVLVIFSAPFHGSASTEPSLLLESPVNGSQVTSPIPISAKINSEDYSLLRITLMNQSRNTLSRQLLSLDTDEGNLINFSTDLFFEIPGDSSEGLLSITLLDSNNRPAILRSASLFLLSEGQTQIEASKSETDWLTIIQPQPGEVLSGGEVRVVGTVRPYVEGPLFFELVTDSGGQIGTRQLSVDIAGRTFSFDIRIPYQYVNEMRDIRLIIRQKDSKFGETIILDSVPIFLTP